MSLEELREGEGSRRGAGGARRRLPRQLVVFFVVVLCVDLALQHVLQPVLQLLGRGHNIDSGFFSHELTCSFGPKITVTEGKRIEVLFLVEKEGLQIYFQIFLHVFKNRMLHDSVSRVRNVLNLPYANAYFTYCVS